MCPYKVYPVISVSIHLNNALFMGASNQNIFSMKSVFIRLKKHPCVILLAFYLHLMSDMKYNLSLKNAVAFNEITFVIYRLIHISCVLFTFLGMLETRALCYIL